MRGSGGVSNYNALNVKYQTHNLHRSGLDVIANYTWAHSLDDLSSTFSDSSQGGSGYIGNLGYLDPTHPLLDWGSSDFDIPQRFVISPIWTTPWYSKGHNVLTEALGGWTVDGVFTARGGTPFSIYDFTYNKNGYSGVPRIVPSSSVNELQAKHGSAGRSQRVPNHHRTRARVIWRRLILRLGISDFGPFPSDMMQQECASRSGRVEHRRRGVKEIQDQ